MKHVTRQMGIPTDYMMNGKIKDNISVKVQMVAWHRIFMHIFMGGTHPTILQTDRSIRREIPRSNWLPRQHRKRE